MADHFEPHRQIAEIGRSRGIAVHRRGRKGRLGAPRRDVLGQHTAHGLRQRHLLGAEMSDDGEQPRFRLGDRDHA